MQVQVLFTTEWKIEKYSENSYHFPSARHYQRLHKSDFNLQKRLSRDCPVLWKRKVPVTLLLNRTILQVKKLSP